MLLTSLVVGVLAAVLIPKSLAQDSSTPMCLENNFDKIKFSSQGNKSLKGKFCAFSFPVAEARLNFTSCCAAMQPELFYQEPCTQYCQVDRITFFPDCITRVAQSGNYSVGNYSTGPVSCWESSAARSQVRTWGGVVVVLGAAVVGLASFA